MWKGQKVSVAFPAYNEGKYIRKAIKDFFAQKWVDEILVVDNNSTDKTTSEVKKTKAKLFSEKKQGLGHALRRAMKEATGDLVITAEPDGTFVGKDVLKLLAYSDEFDLVLGTRTSKELIWEGANMGWFLRIGNVVVAKFLEYLFNGPCLTDVGCTMKLVKRKCLKKIQKELTVGSSHINPEIMTLAIVYGFKVVEVPLNYRGRIGVSKITGSPKKAILVGLRMILLIIQYRLKFWLKKRGR
jgi:glycosyltransferase involved in cell wall biosynthesis